MHGFFQGCLIRQTFCRTATNHILVEGLER